MTKEKKNVDLSHYIEIIKPHQEYLTSNRQWNEYRIGKDLPHSQTLIRKFGSWNAIKEALKLEEVNGAHRPVKYDPDAVKAVLKEHGQHLLTQVKWNEYAKENKLPNYTVIFERLSEDEVFELTGYLKNVDKKSLTKVIRKHYPDKAPTSREWNNLAKTTPHIPSSSTIIVHFGTWKKMIRAVYGSEY